MMMMKFLPFRLAHCRYFTHQFLRQMHTQHHNHFFSFHLLLMNYSNKVMLIRLSASSNLMLKIFYFFFSLLLFQLFSLNINQLGKYFINVYKTKNNKNTKWNEIISFTINMIIWMKMWKLYVVRCTLLNILYFCIIICD